MSEVVLSVQQLTKRFKKGIRSSEEIVALDNVSFELFKGEILGIIGPNGAGKSTLLKILSEITPPSSGKVEYQGHLTSILEVGTGFHPDLSGKENVYLSSSMLGFSKKEIEKRYPDIVAFSGLENFMEMPVKNYSSGMYLRLAFSIAFHSNIDILLVDEVLAVGDAEFRSKCYQRIRDISSSGASIIIISHNTNQILEFCQRCLFLRSGKIIKEGLPLDVIEFYVESLHTKPKPIIQSSSAIALLETKAKGERYPNPIHLEDSITIEIFLKKTSNNSSMEVFIYLADINENRVMVDASALRRDYKFVKRPGGNYKVCCTIPGNFLNRGHYTVGVLLAIEGQRVLEVPEAAHFKVELAEEDQNNEYYRAISCPIKPQLEWKFEKIE